MTGQDWFEKDFYAILGVPKNADDAAIKKAYRKLARTLHPDHNPGDAAAEAKFKDVGEAYAVLSDPEQRKQYDAVRAMAGGGARFAAGAGGPGGGAGGFEDVFSGLFGAGAGRGGGRVRYSTSGEGVNIDDLLGGMFGGGAPAGGRFGRRAQRGADLQATTTLPFRQAVIGSTVTLGVDGRTVTARIPPGVRDGQKIRLRGKGRPGVDGGEPGDLVIAVKVEPHPVFSLSGKDLRVTLPVTFAEAALGAPGRGADAGRRHRAGQGARGHAVRPDAARAGQGCARPVGRRRPAGHRPGRRPAAAVRRGEGRGQGVLRGHRRRRRAGRAARAGRPMTATTFPRRGGDGAARG